MKKTLLSLSLVLTASLLSAQCDELFISEYIEGYANNKAIEIYNPTNAAINLSGYSLVRFSNGSTSAIAETIQQLPDVMLNAKGTYGVVVDLTDMSLFDSQLDKPVWNGYNVIDTIFDQVTGLPVLDDDGNILFGPQYNNNGSALFGNEYNEEYDLQCKANVFLCPEYDTNNTLYFNGNDAMALITGTAVADDGSNLVDVIGVIGEDPVSSGNDAWVTADGQWITKDKTIVRKATIETGRNVLADVVQQLGGTFMGEEWDIYPKNSFQYMRTHNSVCNNTAKPDETSCASFVSADEINQVPFTMFPNPSNGWVNIESTEAIEAVRVFNLMGQLLINQTYNNTNTKTTVNLSVLTSGMYMVDITFEGDKRSIQKLVVE